MNDILTKDITTISNLIKKKSLSPVEVTKSLLKKINYQNKDYRAYITIIEDQALEEAEKIEKEIMNGYYKGPLHGVPISIKDNMHLENTRITNGSIINMEMKSLQDAAIVSQLRSDGAIIVGKTNMDEFANNISGINNHYGTIKNPVKNDYSVGGSSGGSAVSVAADLAFASMGTDTAGSVRVPASCCGIFGFKPTYNLFPTDGITPLAWSLDHVGYFTKSSEDLPILFQRLAPGKVELYDAFQQTLHGLKVGILSDYDQKNNPEVQQQMDDFIKNLTKSGAVIKSIKTDFLENFIDTHFTISAVEAYFYHQQFLHNHEHLYEKANANFFKSGNNIPQKQYFEALHIKEMIVYHFQEIFSEVDILVTPTLPILPPTIDGLKDNWEETLRSVIKYTSPFNMGGLPALSIPYKKSKAGIPIGIQLISNKYNEGLLFEVSNWLTKNEIVEK